MSCSKFDFDEIIPRRGTNSYKWDTPDGDDILPLWVADMDFRTAPPVVEALKRRVDHGIFGYTKVPDEYYRAVCGWFSRRHGLDIDPRAIIYTTGVVPALSAIIKAMTRPGDRVAVMTPAYNCFYSSIRNNGCELADCRLRCDGGRYTIDFELLERIASDERTSVLLLCNPHNPAGRVWSREELLRTGEICLRHGVFVISDEIHCELTYEGHDYTPYASLGSRFSLRSATCISPSKAFNIAGLQIANIVAADEQVRSRIDRAINDNEVCDVNPFGVEALIAAYNEGGEWLDELRRYLWGNWIMLSDFFARELPQYTLSPLEGTYLAWVDCSASGMDSETLAARLLSRASVMVSPGAIYGPGGDRHIRINMACPRPRLAEGLQRMLEVLR
ncbi:MAG: pyridoxal phosphate-dependent aminotransferase [Alistipes sp.]|nr:pyridoxal phosphate-dependent aminotransferase [Alistipes sp.]